MPSTNNPLAAAFEAVPGYLQADAALDAAKARTRELRTPTTVPHDDLRDEVLKALVSGQPIPADLGRRAWEAQQDQAFREAELRLVLGLEPTLKNRRDIALRAGAGKALAVLRPFLDELLERGRPMARALVGVRDAQSAIDRGPEAVDAWSSFTSIVEQYRHIREAQRHLTYAAVGGTEGVLPGTQIVIGGVFPVWSEIANVTEVWPEWDPSALNGRVQRAPWPSTWPDQPFSIRWDRDWVMWLLTTPGVRLWIPTVDELREAHALQTADAKDRGGKAPRDRKGEPRRGRPVTVRGGDGSEWTEIRKPSTQEA